jgi:putative drug exporter of the RND superfamily
MYVFYRWGQFVTRHPKKILLFSLLIIILAVPAIPGGIDLLSPEGWVADDAQSLRAQEIIEDRFDAGGARLWILFIDPESDITHPTPLSEVSDALAPLREHPDVEFIADFPSTEDDALVSADGSRTAVTIQLDSDADPERVYADLRDLVQADTLEVLWGGSAPANQMFNETVARDLVVQQVVSLPITLVLLVIIFGAVVAAALPLSVGIAGIATAVAAIAILARLTDTSVYVLHVATIIGLALAIDYSLFIVSRFREEMARRDVSEAVAMTVGTSGKAIFFAGLTGGIGLLGLVFFPAYALRTMGIGGGIVVTMAVFFALTTLPAILTLLGPRINRGQVREIKPVPTDQAGFWNKLAYTVMRRPVIILLSGLAVLITVGTPFLQATFGSPGIELLPTDSEPRKVVESLSNDFPGQEAQSPVTVIADAGDSHIHEPPVHEDIQSIARHLESMDGIESVESVFRFLPQGADASAEEVGGLREATDPGEQRALAQLISDEAIRFNVTTEAPPNSTEAEDVVREIRELTATTDSLEILTAGTTSFNVDMLEAISGTLPYTLGFVFIVTYLVLCLLLGSIVLPLKAIIANLLSLTAAFGALVWIFQEGNLSGLFMFDAPGYIVPHIAVIMLLVLFGLSMDYEVMLLSRMKEEYVRTGDSQTAIATGLERSGRVITGAAAIMIVVFATGITNQLVMLKSLGIGMAIAIFADATVVRGLVVPSAMRLMGKVNWWAPEWLTTLQKRLGMEEIMLDDDPTTPTVVIGEDANP